jgi:Protein of unknown function (DUF1598)
MTFRITFRPRPGLVFCRAAALAAFLLAPPAVAQIPDFAVPGVPGVWVEQDGNVRSRQVDPDKDLAAVRDRAKLAAAAAKNEKLACVSLPKAIAEARAALAAGKPVPNDLRYLRGMTQVRYVFVYPDDKDLVIAGPAEPFVTSPDGLYAIGKLSRRPVLQLDDLVIAMRTAHDPAGRVFGCRIDPNPKSVEISDGVMKKFASKSRKERMDAMAKELGPQKVSVFGTPADTRLAFVLVAADYKLKRFALGLEPAAAGAPGIGIGHAVDNTRSAMNRFWFETDYEPLRVSPDGNAYEFRGRRIQVKAGAFDFDPRGATDKAMAFAKRFTDKVPALAVAEPLVAELQNVADLSLFATLVRFDRLDRKVGWDVSPLLSDETFPVRKVPVPLTADTLVSATGGSIAAGGVRFAPGQVLRDTPREGDADGALNKARQQADSLRRAGAEPKGPTVRDE